MSVDKFEMFGGKICNPHLPLNIIKDEFSFIRFIPIFIEDEEKRVKQPAVIPRDKINPESMDQVYASLTSLPYKVDLPEIRGGLPLNPKWESRTMRPTNEEYAIIEFKIQDLNLNSRNVEQLLNLGRSRVVINKEKTKSIIDLILQYPHQISKLDSTGAVQVDDLNDLLSSSRLNLKNGGSLKASLTEKNVEELTRFGVSKVKVIDNDQREEMYIVASKSGTEFGSIIDTKDGSVGSALNPALFKDDIADPSTLDEILSHAGLLNYKFVIYMPYRQTWTLEGYSRGELLNTISLAPQEETTIELFIWDRFKRTQEDTVSTEQEGTVDISFTDKDSTEAVKELTKTSNWKFNHSGEVTIPIEKVTIKASHNFEIGEQINDVNKNTHTTISETVRKASARIKSSRQTKISESQEIGREERVTEKIKNSNMCRTLNLDYFEVLSNYTVSTELLVDQAKLCV